jgi:hypothetical protein
MDLGPANLGPDRAVSCVGVYVHHYTKIFYLAKSTAPRVRKNFVENTQIRMDLYSISNARAKLDLLAARGMR